MCHEHGGGTTSSILASTRGITEPDKVINSGAANADRLLDTAIGVKHGAERGNVRQGGAALPAAGLASEANSNPSRVRVFPASSPSISVAALWQVAAGGHFQHR